MVKLKLKTWVYIGLIAKPQEELKEKSMQLMKNLATVQNIVFCILHRRRRPTRVAVFEVESEFIKS